MKKLLIPALLTGGLLLATGCAHRVVFATKTNLGLDVSGTAQMPDKVSFTYGRYEGASVPRSVSGEPYSVYGKIDADVRFFGGHTIQQLFTTGEAANLAAEQESSAAGELKSVAKGQKSFSTAPLFFVTDTSYGLKLSAGKQDISPTLMLGYKRVEGAVIPVETKETEVRSVYADLTINSSSSTSIAAVTNAFPNNKGVRIIQRFATGRAADSLAKKPEFKEMMREAVSPESAAIAGKIVDGKPASIKRIADQLTVAGDVKQSDLIALAEGKALQNRLKREIKALGKESGGDLTRKQLEAVLNNLEPEQIGSLVKKLN